MLEQIQNSAPTAPSVVDAWAAEPGWSHKDWRRASDWKLSAASAKADAQNQLNMAKYNNDYNYWLWQQQTQYNSPEQQVARLKAAGLNPNFNSIEGAGNASSPSPSQGKVQSNFLGAYQAGISARAQRLNEANAVISAFNDLVRNVGQGFDMYKTYVSTPTNEANSYRNALNLLTRSNATEKSIDSQLRSIFLDVAKGGKEGFFFGDHYYDDTPYGRAVLGELGEKALGEKLATARWNNLLKDTSLKDVTKRLKEYELNNLKPKELEKLQNEIDNLFSRTQFIDTQNEMYKTLKVGGMLLPFALMLFKSILF